MFTAEQKNWICDRYLLAATSKKEIIYNFVIDKKRGRYFMYSPKEVSKNLVGIGRIKGNTSIDRLFLLGIMSGIFIACAAVGFNTASCMIENPGVAKLVGAMIFPVGLVMTLVAGSELFTGNTLMVVALYEGETTILKLLKNWIVVYAGNFLGSILVALLIVNSGQLNLFSGALALSTIKVAAAKSSLVFGKAFLLGIGCNFLVCIAVWINFAATDVAGKVIGLYMPIMLFVLAGFEHCVANMYFIPAGLIALTNPDYAAASVDVKNIANLTWSNFFMNNLIPVTLGNIVGGSIMVGTMYWLIYLRGEKKAEQ